MVRDLLESQLLTMVKHHADPEHDTRPEDAEERFTEPPPPRPQEENMQKLLEGGSSEFVGFAEESLAGTIQNIFTELVKDEFALEPVRTVVVPDEPAAQDALARGGLADEE